MPSQTPLARQTDNRLFLEFVGTPDWLLTSEQPAVLESLRLARSGSHTVTNYLSRSAFSNLRALSTDFTALRLGAHLGVLLLPLPRQFVQVAHYLADVFHALRDAV